MPVGPGPDPFELCENFPPNRVRISGRVGAPLATAFQVLTADGLGFADWQTGLVSGRVIKTQDESVAGSTVLQADDELFFTPASGGVYFLFALLVFASPVGGSVPDIALTFGQDATIRGSLNVIGISTGDGAGGSNIQAVNNASGSFGTATGNRLVRLEGTYTGTGAQAGIFWAQATSNAGATIMRAGSALYWHQVI